MSRQKNIEYADTLTCLTAVTQPTLQEDAVVYAHKDDLQVGDAIKHPTLGTCLVLQKDKQLVEVLTCSATFEWINSNYILKSWILD